MRIALTFDDGPHPSLTPQLLLFARNAGAKLTFFVVGSRVSEHRDVLRSQIKEGHEIGNHSWSHPNFARSPDPVVRRELIETDEVIRSCGGKPTLIRPPFGEINEQQRRWVEEEFRSRIVLWNVDSRDWQLRDSEQIADCILRQVKDRAIVLAHDIHRATIEAMPIVFRALALASSHCQLVTVSELQSTACDRTG